MTGTVFGPIEAIMAGFSGFTGRLMRWDPSTRTNQVLSEGLGNANGVKLSPGEDYILVNEATFAQTSIHYLKGAKKGQTEVRPGLIYLDKINLCCQTFSCQLFFRNSSVH